MMEEAVKRGSVEETDKILKEIDKINMSLGYVKRRTFSFPRITNDGFFYPRQEYRPQFLTKPGRPGNEKSLNPFNQQVFYYPAPYLQTPVKSVSSRNFMPNKYYFPVFPMKLTGNSVEDKSKDDGSIRLGTIMVLPSGGEREGRAKEGQNKDSEEDDISVPALIEEIAEYEVMGIPEALGYDTEDVEDDDEEKQIPSTTILPLLPNDKFLNTLKLQNQNEEDEEDDEDEEDSPDEARNIVIIHPRAINISNAFNLTNQIEKFQNFTKKFTFQRGDESLKESTTDKPGDPVDYEESAEEQQDDEEEVKAPNFPFLIGPKEQGQLFKDGGLIIQRLRVRHGIFNPPPHLIKRPHQIYQIF